MENDEWNLGMYRSPYWPVRCRLDALSTRCRLAAGGAPGRRARAWTPHVRKPAGAECEGVHTEVISRFPAVP